MNDAALRFQLSGRFSLVELFSLYYAVGLLFHTEKET